MTKSASDSVILFPRFRRRFEPSQAAAPPNEIFSAPAPHPATQPASEVYAPEHGTYSDINPDTLQAAQSARLLKTSAVCMGGGAVAAALAAVALQTGTSDPVGSGAFTLLTVALTMGAIIARFCSSKRLRTAIRGVAEQFPSLLTARSTKTLRAALAELCPEKARLGQVDQHGVLALCLHQLTRDRTSGLTLLERVDLATLLGSMTVVDAKRVSAACHLASIPSRPGLRKVVTKYLTHLGQQGARIPVSMGDLVEQEITHQGHMSSLRREAAHIAAKETG